MGRGVNGGERRGEERVVMRRGEDRTEQERINPTAVANLGPKTYQTASYSTVPYRTLSYVHPCVKDLLQILMVCLRMYQTICA